MIRTVIPGGGGNAICNLADLGVNVLPVGVVGDDEAGRLLLQRLRQKKIPLTGICKLKGYTTVTKTRILAGMTHNNRQQVVRVNREPESAPNSRTPSANWCWRRASMRGPRMPSVLSDYGYGAATPQLFDQVRSAARNIPVLLDSRYRLPQYRGITAATPNEPEVEEALGTRIGTDSEKLLAAGKTIIERMKLQSLVITRGRDGMVAFERRHKPLPIPIFGSDQVADVTGAGDTVIASFAAALAAGADTESAARLANYAGGIVVMKRGTATVSRQELIDAIDSDRT